jgi:hypothetical protein
MGLRPMTRDALGDARPDFAGESREVLARLRFHFGRAMLRILHWPDREPARPGPVARVRARWHRRARAIRILKRLSLGGSAVAILVLLGWLGVDRFWEHAAAPAPQLRPLPLAAATPTPLATPAPVLQSLPLPPVAARPAPQPRSLPPVAAAPAVAARPTPHPRSLPSAAAIPAPTPRPLPPTAEATPRMIESQGPGIKNQ